MREIIEQNIALAMQSLRQDAPKSAHRLLDAMEYALTSGGKRLRPYMVFLAAEASSALSEEEVTQLAWPSALAIEFVHTYSLVHDDLPSMDNDTMRRGRPTVHIAFDEATAVLAGDALLTEAFRFFTLSQNNAMEQCFELVQAIGTGGMLAGQTMDIHAKTHELSTDDWLLVHALKTAKLFSASCALGALAVQAELACIHALKQFGYHFGVAFQLRDDLDDEKTENNQTPTLIQQIGHDSALLRLKSHVEKARMFLKDVQRPEKLEALCEKYFNI